MKKALFCAKTLSAVIILSLVLNLFGITAFASKHSVGDLIQFGSYPQNLCEDEEIISQLEKIKKDWKYYDYYGGNGDYGSMKFVPYAHYADVSYGGKKYRAVYIEEYRPSLTTISASTASYQANMSFLTDEDFYENDINMDNYVGHLFDSKLYKEKVYYFEYEPIWWQILNPSTGFVVSCDILDAQPFNNNLYWADKNGDGSDGTVEFQGIKSPAGNDDNKYYEFFSTEGGVIYANNWKYSSIREWLNEDFYNTAFSSSEQHTILYADVDNTNILKRMAEHMSFSASTSLNERLADAYACGYTTDKIFLLSADEIITEKYGFEPYSTSAVTQESETRTASEISDYAKSQGLNMKYGTAPTLLRSPYINGGSMGVFTITSSGGLGSTTTHDTGNGIRPAMNVDLSSLTAYSGGDGSYSDDDGGYIDSDDDYNSDDSYYEDNVGDDDVYSSTNSISTEADDEAGLIALGIIIVVVVIVLIIRSRKKKALPKNNNIYPHPNQNNIQLYDNQYFNDLFNNRNNNKPK